MERRGVFDRHTGVFSVSSAINLHSATKKTFQLLISMLWVAVGGAEVVVGGVAGLFEK